jgi:glycosyltransferase involved in cell wall biosynthesis
MDKRKPKNLRKSLKITTFHCGFIYSGGGERIVLEEAKGLIKRGYEVEVYAPTVDRRKCFPDFLKELKIKMLLPSFSEKLPYRNAIRMVASSFLAPFLSLSFRDTDIFLGANQPGAWLAFCMSKILGKPYIVYLNQPNRVIYPRPIDTKFGWYTTNKDYHILYKVLKLVRPVLGYLDKISIASASRVLVNGDYIGDIIENVYSVRVIDAHAGAKSFAKSRDVSKGSIKINGKIIKKPYALITNRHDPQKRFDYVIRAMKRVVEKFPKATLVIPGPLTGHSGILVRLAKKLNIEHNVYFTKTVTEHDLQRLYKNACVYCYPSPQEDFGLGPLEAGGWGVPTVAWNHAGPTVTVENGVTGFLANPYKISDYADKMLMLFKNKKLRKKMGEAAYNRTKSKFSWDKHLDILEETIKRVYEK